MAFAYKPIESGVELSEEDLMQEGADKHLAEIIGNQKEKALSQEVAQ